MTARSALATAGSVAAAIGSSACCWLPLVSLGAGVSTAGLAAWFEPYRPWLLAAAALLLALGFYLNYRRREVCGPDGTCETPNPRLLRFNRVSLWVSTVFVVAFALFPSYVGALFGSRDPGIAAAGDSSVVVLSIEGMSCEGCEAGVEEALARVPGVEHAEARYAGGNAIVKVATSGPPAQKALEMAVAAAGYRVTSVAGGATTLGAGATRSGRNAVAAASPFAGQWKASFPDDELGEIEVLMDLGTIEGSRWVGQFDIPAVGLEDFPVTVTLVGDSVTLDFSAINTVIAGRISADGKTIAGVARTHGEEEPARFERVGDTQFSEMFLRLEAAADDPTSVQPLSADGHELRAAFNRDTDKVRLLMLLAPS